MSEEINYDKLSYDELLRFARGSAKVMIPRMCAALKRENPHYSNYDIREIVTKDCISIWQKTTIVDALPDEYKDKAKAEASRKGRQMQLLQEQTSGLITEREDAEGEGIDDNGIYNPKYGNYLIYLEHQMLTLFVLLLTISQEKIIYYLKGNIF